MADGVRISIPSRATKAEEARYVETLLRRYQKRKQYTDLDLTERSAKLAARYHLKRPLSIQWAENQNTRWGSCTPDTQTIRISSKVATFPSWVLDYVIVHELAHLSVHGHNQDFWRLVYQFPRTERARGFLIGKGLEAEESEAGGVDGDDSPGADVADNLMFEPND